MNKFILLLVFTLILSAISCGKSVEQKYEKLGSYYVGMNQPSMRAEDIYSQTLPSVITLKVKNFLGQNFTGSAFLAIDQNIAVTAWHVVHDAVQVIAVFSDGEERPVLGLIDYSRQYDIALISIESNSRPIVKLLHTFAPIGSKIYVIGAPRGYGFSIADGLLSQIQDLDGFPQYQVSCPFSTGVSGGPLLNDRGEVIGIASWSKSQSQNLNFAIPSMLIKNLNHTQPIISWNQR
jgi:serine protease Do